MVPTSKRTYERVAIVHEWLTIPGGSEKVVLALLDLFPGAEIFTSVYDPAPWPEAITSRTVHPSFLNRIPGAPRRYRHFLPLMNAAFESFDLSEFDLVISSNHSCAKNVLTRPETRHVCYCHTPMRYAWEPRFLREEAIGAAGRVVLPALTSRLRRQDLAASTRPDQYVANSHAVAGRIAKYYRREATVIHPPVDVERFLSMPRTGDGYYLFLGRIVPYKKADMAVAACRRLGRPLKVIGEGRSIEALRGMAGPGIELCGSVDDEELAQLMAGAKALLFPGEEDFGIVPVEAQAAGVPVIAYGVGGARDSVIDGETGVLYPTQTVDGLCEAIERFERLSLNERDVRDNARRFDSERFAREISALIAAPAPGV